MDISFLIVNWNVRDLLRQALLSIRAYAPDSLTWQVIVVDNASTDGSREMVRTEFPDVRLIENPNNTGFTHANNQALAEATGRYLFFLNPDAEVTSGAIPTIVSYAAAHPRVGVIGPQLVYPDGTLQSSRRRFPTFATALLESTRLQQWFPRNRWLTRYYVLDTPAVVEQEVDWVVGAAMFARREVYDQIGGLDERFFMYSEEMDWCFRAKQRGWQVAYVPAARVIHHEAKSSEQVLAARDIYFHSSKVRFFRKYRGPWMAAMLRLFLLGMFTFQLLEEGAKWLVGHKRGLRAERIRAYGQVLRSGLA